MGMCARLVEGDGDPARAASVYTDELQGRQV
jgi:hypothetical protein